MVREIDLHTTDVDVADAAMAQFLHGLDSGASVGVEFSFALRRDGPWPGNVCLAGFVPATRFHRCDCRQQPRRDFAAMLFGLNGLTAKLFRVLKSLFGLCRRNHHGGTSCYAKRS